MCIIIIIFTHSTKFRLFEKGGGCSICLLFGTVASMRSVYVLIFVTLSWISIHGSVTFNATVIRVVDGDSLHIKTDSGKRQKIRLFGIDAPEMLQKDGPKSGRYFATRIGGERVDIVP